MTFAIGSILTQGLLISAQPVAVPCATGGNAAAELLTTHEAARRAHLLGDVDLLAPGIDDDMVSVSNGDVSVDSRDKVTEFFKGYFARIKYLEWSDVAPPIINISRDGQTGWMAVKIRARYLERARPEAGEKAFRSSWIATYRRVGCEWKMTGNSSAVIRE